MASGFQVQQFQGQAPRQESVNVVQVQQPHSVFWGQVFPALAQAGEYATNQVMGTPETRYNEHLLAHTAEKDDLALMQQMHPDQAQDFLRAKAASADDPKKAQFYNSLADSYKAGHMNQAQQGMTGLDTAQGKINQADKLTQQARDAQGQPSTPQSSAQASVEQNPSSPIALPAGSPRPPFQTPHPEAETAQAGSTLPQSIAAGGKAAWGASAPGGGPAAATSTEPTPMFDPVMVAKGRAAAHALGIKDPETAAKMLLPTQDGSILLTPTAVLSGRADHLGLDAKAMIPQPSPQNMTPQQVTSVVESSNQAASLITSATRDMVFSRIRTLQSQGKDVPMELQNMATISSAQLQSVMDTHAVASGGLPGDFTQNDLILTGMLNRAHSPNEIKAITAQAGPGVVEKLQQKMAGWDPAQRLGMIQAANGLSDYVIKNLTANTEATAVSNKNTQFNAGLGEQKSEFQVTAELAKQRLALEATVHQDTKAFNQLDLQNKLAIAKLEYDPMRWKHSKESEEALAVIRQRSLSNACKGAGFLDDPTAKNAALGQHAGILEAGVKIADSVLKQAQEADQNILPGASKDPKDPANVKKAASQAAIATAQENLKTAQKNYSDFYDTEVKPASARDAVGRTLPGYYYRKMLATAGGMDSHGDTHVPAGFKEYLNEMYRVNGIRNKTTNELATWEDLKADLVNKKSPILENPGALGVLKEALQNYQQPYSSSKDFSPMNIDPVGAALKTAPSKQPSHGISKQPSPSAAPKGYAEIVDSKDFQEARQNPAFKGASDKEIARWLQRHRARNESIPENPNRQPIAGDKKTEGPGYWETLTDPGVPQKLRPGSGTNRLGRVVDQ